MLDDYAYTRPPGKNEPVDAQAAWCERTRSLSSVLNDALALNAVEFWRYITTDDTLLTCIDSYLRNAERSFELGHTELADEARECIADVDQAVFLCCLRMSTYKELGNSSEFTRTRWATMIYERFLFDIPRLLDFVAIYSRRNGTLVSRILEQIFEGAPRYVSDFQLCARAVADTVLQKVRKRIRDLSSGGLKDVSVDVMDILSFLNDLVNTLRAFAAMLPISAEWLVDCGFLEQFVRFYDECMPLLARVTLHKASSDSVRRLRLVRITTLRFYVELLDSACVQPWKTVLNEKGSEKNQQSSDLAETKRTRNVALDSLRSSETDTVPKRPENSADRLASLASRLENMLHSTVLSDESVKSRFVAHLARFTTLEEKLTELVTLLNGNVDGVDAFALKSSCEAAIAELRSGRERTKRTDAPAVSQTASVRSRAKPEASASAASATTSNSGQLGISDAEFEQIRAILPDMTRERIATYLPHYRSVDAFLNAALEFDLPEVDAEADPEADAEIDTGANDVAAEFEELETEPDTFENVVTVSAFRKRGTGLSKRELTASDAALRERTLALLSRIENEEEVANVLEYDDELDDAYDEPAKPLLLARGFESDAAEDPDAQLERLYGRPVATPRIFQQRGIAPTQAPIDPRRRPVDPAHVGAASASASTSELESSTKPKEVKDSARPPKDDPRAAKNPRGEKPDRNKGHWDKRNPPNADFRKRDFADRQEEHQNPEEDFGPVNDARRFDPPRSFRPPFPSGGPPRGRNAPRGRGGYPNAANHNNQLGNAQGRPDRQWDARGPRDNQWQVAEQEAEVDGNEEEGGVPRGPDQQGNTLRDRQMKERNKAYAGNHNRKALAMRKMNRY